MSLRHVAWDDGSVVDLQLAQRVADADEVGHVLLGRLPALAGVDVVDEQTLAEEREDSPALLDQARRPWGRVHRGGSWGGRSASASATTVGGNLTMWRLAIDSAARIGEEVERFVALYEDTRSVEDLESAQMQIVKISLRRC